MTKVLFIPPTWNSSRFREHYISSATTHGFTAMFFEGGITEAVLNQDSDIVLAQGISPDALSLVDDSWVVLDVENTYDVVDLFNAMHPELGAHWAATHGSAALAYGSWLVELGARLCSPHGDISWPDLQLSKVDSIELAQHSSSPQSNPLAFYQGLRLPLGTEWIWFPGMVGGANPVALEAGSWIELTGRAQHIVNGPNIFLPPGRWKATLSFSIDPEGSSPSLFCEWGGGAHEKPSRHFEIRRAGHYEISMECLLTVPDAVHFLLATQTALFSGKARIGELRVRRVG
ncbi:hypothetical protein [uncultured Brevundimonas sp.]|uniref:hypothetical protein n=1 Tax=uncultured Brevundimonas sp. TaxID=213418 RepID=UPI0025DA4091|nr:hypothetical protein [uncultured Brevundimonas sp.]